MSANKLFDFLESKVEQYNNSAFIPVDPICVPHQFTKKQDIEIAGFFAAIFAWGNRTTIINKTKELMGLMDNAPHDFMINCQDADRKALLHFKHRTFQTDDLLYFISFFEWYYKQYDSLEYAFSYGKQAEDEDMRNGLIGFRQLFFSQPHLRRTQKHISSPLCGSSCKRINMFLRWMVRKDKSGVDFGLWDTIGMQELIIPLDVHVGRVSRNLGLLDRDKDDWTAAKSLTDTLKKFNAQDPTRYDFALFSIGVMEKF